MAGGPGGGGTAPIITDYQDDSSGGSEAAARISFATDTGRGEVQLSWLAKLSNGFRIEGDEGTITGSIFDWGSVQLTSKSGRRRSIPLTGSVRSLGDIAPRITDNFLAVIEDGAEFLIPAREVVPSIALIEQCYARRQRFPMPWQDDIEPIRYAL